jgi:hypothetical protein
MAKVGALSLLVKVHQEKNRNQKKNSTVFDRESNSLSTTVDLFFDCGFFFLVHFYGQIPASEFYQGYSNTTVNLVLQQI